MITINSNNSQQSFGMAYASKNPKATATKFAKIIERNFEKTSDEADNLRMVDGVKKLLMEIKDLKTKVIVDGNDVILEHPLTQQQYTAVGKLVKGKEKVIKLGLRGSNGEQNIETAPLNSCGEAKTIIENLEKIDSEGFILKHIAAAVCGEKFDRETKTAETILDIIS